MKNTVYKIVLTFLVSFSSSLNALINPLKNSDYYSSEYNFSDHHDSDMESLSENLYFDNDTHISDGASSTASVVTLNFINDLVQDAVMVYQEEDDTTLTVYCQEEGCDHGITPDLTSFTTVDDAQHMLANLLHNHYIDNHIHDLHAILDNDF